MTVRELNRAYRAAGVSSPFRPAWLSPVAMGVLIALWPGVTHRAGGLTVLLVLSMGACSYPLLMKTFLPRAFTPAQHMMAWTYGPSRSRLVLVNVLCMAGTTLMVGVSAGAASRALVWLRWNPPELTTRSLLGDVVICSSIMLALVGWLMAMAATSTSRLVPLHFRILRSLSEEDPGVVDWMNLLWRIPLTLVLLGAIHAPLVYAFYRLGVVPGCLLMAAVAFPAAFLLTVTGECGGDQGWLTLPRPREVRREVLQRSFGPLRALFWTQSPLGASVIVVAPLVLAGSFVAFCVPDIPVPSLVAYLPCLIHIAWLAYPIAHSGQAAALHTWGVDLRRQARILWWSFLGGSAATTLLGLGLALRWGEGRTADKIFFAISMWSVQLILLLPWSGKWLVVGAGWLLSFFWKPFGDLSPGPAMAYVLPLAAGYLLFRTWRASADESALKERLYDFTFPAPWALAFLGRGARRGAFRRARRPSPRE